MQLMLDIDMLSLARMGEKETRKQKLSKPG